MHVYGLCALGVHRGRLERVLSLSFRIDPERQARRENVEDAPVARSYPTPSPPSSETSPALLTRFRTLIAYSPIAKRPAL